MRSGAVCLVMMRASSLQLPSMLLRLQYEFHAGCCDVKSHLNPNGCRMPAPLSNCHGPFSAAALLDRGCGSRGPSSNTRPYMQARISRSLLATSAPMWQTPCSCKPSSTSATASMRALCGTLALAAPGALALSPSGASDVLMLHLLDVGVFCQCARDSILPSLALFTLGCTLVTTPFVLFLSYTSAATVHIGEQPGVEKHLLHGGCPGMHIPDQAVDGYRTTAAPARALVAMTGAGGGRWRIRCSWAHHHAEAAARPLDPAAMHAADPANTNVHIGNLPPEVCECSQPSMLFLARMAAFLEIFLDCLPAVSASSMVRMALLQYS